MLVIHKYKLEIEYSFYVSIPQSIKPVHIDIQNNEIFLWGEVVPEDEPVPHILYCVATGGTIPRGAQHIGTIVDDFGELPGNEEVVLHYYWYPNSHNPNSFEGE